MIPRPRDGREPPEPVGPEHAARHADPGPGRAPGPDPDPAPAGPDPEIDHDHGPHPDPDPDTSDPEGGGEEKATAEMMRLLGGHVPLALLADLAERDGPPSPVILEDEGLPDVAWWESGSR